MSEAVVCPPRASTPTLLLKLRNPKEKKKKEKTKTSRHEIFSQRNSFRAAALHSHCPSQYSILLPLRGEERWLMPPTCPHTHSWAANGLLASKPISLASRLASLAWDELISDCWAATSEVLLGGMIGGHLSPPPAWSRSSSRSKLLWFWRLPALYRCQVEESYLGRDSSSSCSDPGWLLGCWSVTNSSEGSPHGSELLPGSVGTFRQQFPLFSSWPDAVGGENFWIPLRVSQSRRCWTLVGQLYHLSA